MSVVEETMAATLDAQGRLQLPHPPQLPPGPVVVTIRSVTPVGRRRTLADVAQEIAAEQRARNYPGLSEAELLAFDAERQEEDEARDRESNAARSDVARGDF